MSGLLVERDGGIVRLTLNRPEAGNAVDLPLARALLAAAIDIDTDPSVRCVVLTGAGRMFCAGGDIAGMAAAGDKAPAFLAELAGVVHMAVAKLARMSKPLLVLVNGPAAGAGLSLALLGDITLAARSSHYTAAYTAIGLTPDGGMTWLLPRLAGLRIAQEMILTNRRVGSEEAARLGLVTRLVDDEGLAEEGANVAASLAASATAALGVARNLLGDSFTSGLEAQMEREARGITAAGAGAESREGIAAFLGKRKPDFASAK
ncbi:enoyl-CoA hydratase/isomerase family protein [Sphingoaurantiacus capsulatus]|uniref:Enoyl-CoA hydratase/isomerase family protein n=1 Tax=Sphingoaurantiacus capsulatus TaxID=1771310 RepID=A0ABV7XDM9_9SPHN